jgi:predicted DNA-binding protein
MLGFLDLDDKTIKKIEKLARTTGKPEKTVLREVVETGLRNYKSSAKNAAKALLELAKWAEENNITGPKDLSVNHNTYFSGEE